MMQIQVIPAWQVERVFTPSDRTDAKTLVEKLYKIAFQKQPDGEALTKFLEVAETKPQPLTDQSIRELASLMMTTPSYQVC